MTRRDVHIHIVTQRSEIADSLFDDPNRKESPDELDLLDEMDEYENAELIMEGRMITTPTEIRLLYAENDLTGMGNSFTAVCFQRQSPGLVSLLRTGEVSTALVFEQGKRHICVYRTPFGDFEICVKSFTVENNLLTSGKIFLDYIVEIHGAKAERCKMTITAIPDKELFEDAR